MPLSFAFAPISCKATPTNTSPQALHTYKPAKHQAFTSESCTLLIRRNLHKHTRAPSPGPDDPTARAARHRISDTSIPPHSHSVHTAAATMGAVSGLIVVLVTILCKRLPSFPSPSLGVKGGFVCKADSMCVVPPVGVFMIAGCGADLFVNICLTLLGYVLSSPSRVVSLCRICPRRGRIEIKLTNSSRVSLHLQGPPRPHSRILSRICVL